MRDWVADRLPVDHSAADDRHLDAPTNVDDRPLVATPAADARRLNRLVDRDAVANRDARGRHQDAHHQCVALHFGVHLFAALRRAARPSAVLRCAVRLCGVLRYEASRRVALRCAAVRADADDQIHCRRRVPAAARQRGLGVPLPFLGVLLVSVGQQAWA